MNISLPIDELRDAFEEAGRRVVVSAPTGSGKSTRVPTWCAGKVLVIEPRRLACRALATRVAELEGARVGGAIGYHVRDDRRWGVDTRIVFATPGIVLRGFDEIARYDAIILDELHERRLDTDLLLAMLSRDYEGRLVAMSATLDGERVAAYLEGVHLAGEGRLFPVDVRHEPGRA
ncbi:MAG: DEAD/DEAH box helicase, partial [Deltaproteobacteria bacterium]|nr:DEAD/DEAH box helicase [Deltaproteobacteria bacterium]